jgi:hypothetical protein
MIAPVPILDCGTLALLRTASNIDPIKVRRPLPPCEGEQSIDCPPSW